jgi:hypothetical protein
MASYTCWQQTKSQRYRTAKSRLQEAKRSIRYLTVAPVGKLAKVAWFRTKNIESSNLSGRIDVYEDGGKADASANYVEPGPACLGDRSNESQSGSTPQFNAGSIPALRIIWKGARVRLIGLVR